MTLNSSSLSADARVAPPLSRARAGHLIERLVPKPSQGRLHLVLPNGTRVDRSGALAGNEVELTVHRWRALWRLWSGGDVGFAQSYIDGDWSTPDLTALLTFFADNESAFLARTDGRRWSRLKRQFLHRRSANTKAGSKRNIAAHYDLGNAFYRTWLDSGMNYSSGIYTGHQGLEQAQIAKLDHVSRLLGLTGGERVLEIGCGWGALADHLLTSYHCDVTGITLSEEQLAYATARLDSFVARGDATLQLRDYRDISGQYDRIVSIEMIEAVGESNWLSFFQRLNACLVDGGIAVVQAITIDEARYAAYRKRPDFIQRYIFPGGMLPTASHLRHAAERAGLSVVAEDQFGDSYARTLQDWRDRFTAAWPQIETLGFDRRFRRMWEYYLAYCEVGFRKAVIDLRIFKFVKIAAAPISQ